MGCLLLSGKTSETPRKLRKILAIYLKFLGEENHSESLIFHQYEKKLVCMERVIMYTLGFSFKVEHPYKHLIEIHRSLSAYIPSLFIYLMSQSEIVLFLFLLLSNKTLFATYS
eukprot:gb/GECH01010600.1/.p1 GENE.gb/GECH01010600.1/~~gb/GECH01010600.1/.p1  ORF type:complete len:113 (+),score=7.84 gb/GECH01010600.1/:1-339(+)